MKKRIVIIAAFIMCGFGLSASAQVDPAKVPVIETNVSCDTLVAPNVFYLSVTINDSKGAGKAGIEKTEVSVLMPILKRAGVDTKNDVSVTGFSSDYNKKGTDVVAFKSYQVKVTTVAQINEITDKLTQANIGNVYIIKAGVSNFDQLVNILRVKAIKQSRKEAELMTGAIGYKAGSPLRISYYGMSNPLNEAFFTRNSMMLKSSDSMANSEISNNGVDQYRKVRITASVNVSYEILAK